MFNVYSKPSIQKSLGGFGLWCGLILFPPSVQSAETLQWDANTETDLAGYILYQGITEGSYGNPIEVGNVTSYTVSGLDPGMTYYFAVTAYDTGGNESGPSNEVSVYVSAVTSQLSVSVSGSGTVVSNPSGILCASGTCSASYETGSAISLIPEASRKWSFSGWTGACSGSGECVVQLSTDKIVEATFSKTSPGGGGNGGGKGGGRNK